MFKDAAFDLAYAIDTFPYLVLSGRDLAKRDMSDIARVLRPGGTVPVLNYSYSGDLDRDRGDIAASVRSTGLRVLRDLTTWDAVTFQMVREP